MTRVFISRDMASVALGAEAGRSVGISWSGCGFSSAEMRIVT